MKMSIRILFSVILLIQFSSCNEEISKGLEAFPVAFGTLNDLIIIADDDVWEGPLGDSIRNYYGASYPIMPTPEPIFDLRHFNAEQINSEILRRQLRTYLIIADLSDSKSGTTKMIKQDLGEERVRKAMEDSGFNSTVGRDKWARNQLLIYLFGNSKEAVAASIQSNFNGVANRIYTHDERQLIAKTYAAGMNRFLQNELDRNLGVNAQIPSEFIQAVYKEEQNLMWFRKETKDASMNVVLKKMNYTSENQLTEGKIKEQLNTFGKEFVTTNEEGAYLRVNDWDLPVYTYQRTLNDQYALEIRGIWETENDYMGGPYFSYAILSKDQKDLLYVHCFSYAPGSQKRDIMQQLEQIVHSISF